MKKADEDEELAVTSKLLKLGRNRPKLSYLGVISSLGGALSDSPSCTSAAESLQYFFLFLLLSRPAAPRPPLSVPAGPRPHHLSR